MKKVLVVGYGRFGALLASLCAGKYAVSVAETDSTKQKEAETAGFQVVDINTVPEFVYIFLAVPISSVADVLELIGPLINKEQVVIDICSVKVYPVQQMRKHISRAQILATHPLFGPDSVAQGLKGMTVAFCPIRITDENAKDLRDFWTDLGAKVVETTPEKHDEDSVYSQAFTYSLAKIIKAMKLPELAFTTRSYLSLKEIADRSARDSETLFHDMLLYNPYLRTMSQELNIAVNATLEKIKQIENEAKPILVEKSGIQS